VQSILKTLGQQVTVASTESAALHLAAREIFDMVLVDVSLAGDGASGLVGRLRAAANIPSILVLAQHGRAADAIRSLAWGADDYLLKPLNRHEVRSRIGRILRWQDLDDRVLRQQKELSRKYILGNLVCRSPGMRRVRAQILQVASARSTVLVQGESGVGKELVAKAIHFNSGRRNAPFIAINCSAIPVTLIESELFGHERGSFTGAHERQKGKFELADGGTIFLDEVGEMNLQTQAKLLRVLEEREFMRVGGGREVRVDVRVLAATNSDLEGMIARRRFREDLYFRLKVITINVPPLRDRVDDIPELARLFLDQICRDNVVQPKRLTDHWPGNVRELKNALESTTITTSREIIQSADLPDSMLSRAVPGGRSMRTQSTITMRDMERDLLRRTLINHHGNRTHSARALRIGVRTLQRKIKEYRIRIPYNPKSLRGGAMRHRSTRTPMPESSPEGMM
jgi:DNA-binding NtrC family response regulator